jgi:hypothetical protein
MVIIKIKKYFVFIEDHNYLANGKFVENMTCYDEVKCVTSYVNSFESQVVNSAIEKCLY